MGFNLFTSSRARSRRDDDRQLTIGGRARLTAMVAPIVAIGLVVAGAPAIAAADDGGGTDAQQTQSAAPADENAAPPADATEPAPPEESAAPTPSPSPADAGGGSDTGDPGTTEPSAPAPKPAARVAPVPAATSEPTPSPSPSGGTADLTLKKVVEGGDASPSSWTLQVSLDGESWTTLPQNAATALAFGTYDLRETGGPDGYELVDLSCDSYTWDAEAMTITLKEGDHNTCTFTNRYEQQPQVDLALVKTSSDIPERGVDYGEEFSWYLTVTNVGAADATDAVVTDEIPGGVTVQGVVPPAGWTDESVGSSIRVLIPSLAVGESGVIEVIVTVDEQPTTAAPFLPPGSDTPTLTLPSDEFVNTACVKTPGDENDENDCDTNTVPRKILAANVWVSCINDAPFLMYEVKVSKSLEGLPITLTWTPTNPAKPASKVVTLTAASGRIDWPGVKWDANGVSYDWPGWRPLRDSDFGSNGLPLPGLIVYGNSVRDTSQPDEGWRQLTDVTISVNPHITFTAIYPPATPQCAVNRPTAVLAETGGGSQIGPLGTLAALTLFGGVALLRWSRRRHMA